MKWLSFFKPNARGKRKKVQDGRGVSPEDEEASSGSESDEGVELTHKRRLGASPLEATRDAERSLSRPSLDQWFEARRARTSIDINTTTTTDKLTVCKAGVTTVINRTYIVIKHLGSGTYGQVKLAFNLRDHKLYAIKLCRKSQYAGAAMPSPRANGLSRIRRSLNGGAMAAAGGAQAGGAPRSMLGGPAPAQAAGPPAWGQRSTVSGCPMPPSAAAATPAAAAGAMPPPAAVLLPPPAPAGPPVGAQRAGPQQQLPQQQQQLQQPVNEPMAMDVQHEGQQPVVPQPQQQPGGPFPPQQPSVAAPPASMQPPHGGGVWPGPAQGPGPGPGNTSASDLSRPPSDLSRPSFNWGGGGQQRPLGGGPSGAGAGSGQVGVQRLGPGAMPRFRYSSAAAGMLPPAPLQGAGSPPLASPDSLETTTSDTPGAFPAPPAGAPPVFRKRPVAAEEEGMGAMGPGGQRRRAEEWVREIAIMKKLTHPNIVRLVEVIDDPGSDNLLLVMEYVEGMSLHPQRIGNSQWEAVPEHEVWRRTRDVLQGLDYLHYHGVVHGDLKPANLMLDSNTRQVKIVDFGSAVISNPGGAAPPGSFSAFMGGGAMSCTPAFRSPESLKAGYRPSFELDMWALGVTVYMWVFGQLPFNGAAPFLIYECIRRKELCVPPEADISDELRDFLQALLDKDPSQRLDVVGALNHAWVTGKGTAPLPIIQRGGDACSCMDTDAVVLLGQQPPPSGAGGGVQGSGHVIPRSSSHQGAAMGLMPHKRLRCGPQARVLSQEELDQAISRSLGGHAISELMGMLFEEVHLPARHPIIRAGDPVDTIYLITQGEVEIYQELPPEEAAAAALLLGSSAHRSRILATVLGPPSLERCLTERETASLSGTLDRLQPFAPEPMAVDGGASAGPASGMVVGSVGASSGEHLAAHGPGSMEAVRPSGPFGRWLAGAMGRPSGEHKYVPTVLGGGVRQQGSGSLHAGEGGSQHGAQQQVVHSSSSAMDTDTAGQQPGLGVPQGLAGFGLPSAVGGPASPRHAFRLGGPGPSNSAFPQAQQPTSSGVTSFVAAQQQAVTAQLAFPGPPAGAPRVPATPAGATTSSSLAAGSQVVSTHVGANPQLLTAAACSLAQPIISGLSTGHRQLFCGPHIKGYQKPLFDLGTVGEGDDDEVGEASDLLDAIVSTMAPLMATAMGSEEGVNRDQDEGSAGEQQVPALTPGQQRRQHLMLLQSCCSGLGSGQPASGPLSYGEPGSSGYPVVILAVKGPGDTLGFASWEARPSHTGAGKGTSVTEGAAPADSEVKPAPPKGQEPDPAAAGAPRPGGAAGTGLAKSGNFSAPQLRCNELGRLVRGAAAACITTSSSSEGPAGGTGAGSGGHGDDAQQHTVGAGPLVGLGSGVGPVAAEQACMLTADTCEACAARSGEGARGGATTSMGPPRSRPRSRRPSQQPPSSIGGAAASVSSALAGMQPAVGPAPVPGLQQQLGSSSNGSQEAAGSGAAGEQPQLPPQQQAAPVARRPTWRAHVRTRGEVVAFKADVEHMQRLSKEFPELEAALKHMAVQQETDLLVSEALRQLRLVSAGIPHAAQHAAQQQQQQGSAGAGPSGAPTHHAALSNALRAAGPAPPASIALQQQMVQ